MRVVSLLPSATELICAVGGRADLVGVSHEWDHPPTVIGLPTLTAPRVRLPSASDAIDRAVREALVDALAIYAVDGEALRALKPEVLVTQDLCDVCAVSLEDVACALAPIDADPPTLVSLRPTRLAHVLEDVERVGRALGLEAGARACVTSLQARLDALFERLSGCDRPGVLTIEWTDPVMIGGTWMPDLVDLAGGRTLVATAGEPAPTLDLQALSTLDPDVVVVKACGYDLERGLAEIPVLQRTLPWNWRAIQTGQLYIADGNALFNRSGPRLIDSAELLAALLHPERVPELLARHAPMVRRVGPDGAVRPVA